MIELREYDEKYDLPGLRHWAWKRGVPQPEADFLPRIGLICPAYCAGFLFQTDSKVAMIGNLISNPQSKKEWRSQALDLLIEMLYNRGRLEGFKRITIAANLPHVKERYLRLGFKEGDIGVDHFFKGE